MRPLKRTTALLLSLSLILSLLIPIQAVKAAEVDTAAQILDTRQLEIAPDTYYNWYSMKVPRGLEKVHSVQFNPSNPNLELIEGTKDGKVYGSEGVTKMAAYYDKPGQRVIAGVNGDFFDLTKYGTGVPGGLFMGDGKILNTPDSNYAVFMMDFDGTTRYVPNPTLTRTVTIKGTTSNISHINRYREPNQLVLYTFDYADTTKTNNLGDEVVLDVLEGDVKPGQTMRLKVAEVRKDTGNSPLTEGKVVLSASGTARPILSGLQAGDEITASFAFPPGYENVKLAMSGYMLMQNGVVLNDVPPAGVHPRTAIGTKADGTVVMMEIDGRAPGFSEGVETSELGQIMKDMGVVNALNLDGGGSSTFIARLPGESTFRMLNRPSDGVERQTGNSLLLINKTPAADASKLVIQPQFERVLAGTALPMQAKAVDATGHPATFTGTVSWSTNATYGTIDGNGTFTAGSTAGVAPIQATSAGLSGSGSVEVVTALTELKFPDAEKAVDSGSTITLKVQALRNGQEIVSNNRLFQWRVEGDIGSVDAAGVFHATTESGKAGKIFAKYGNVETSMGVKVGTPPVMLEDFEGDLSRYLVTAGASYNKSIASITNQDEYVRAGNQALKLEYDFTGKPSTSGAYLQAKNAANYIQIPGYPKKIGMWVYGDNSGYWLRAQIRANGGTASGTPINFTDDAVGVNWTGWKYVEADVPQGLTLPLTMDMPVRHMATAAKVKRAGAIYVDNIRAIYGPTDDDFEPPIIKNIGPAEGSTVRTNLPTLQANAEDAGYDPSTHPGTTLIDPNKIFVYLDGILVPHTLYPPEGRISHRHDVPLADGVHKAKIQVRDLSGNRTEKEWTFNVDTGSSKFVYNAPVETYAGNTYTLDISGSKAAGIHAGELQYLFEPDKIEALQFVPGSKLDGTLTQAEINQAVGTVKVTFSNLDSVSLTDQDLLGQIQYRVKSNATEKHTIRFQSGAIELTASPGSRLPFFGLPIEATIKHNLQLNWDEYGVVEGNPTSFAVTDEAGKPVDGVKLLVDNAERGTTDSAGKLVIADLTSALKTYTIQAVKGTMYSPVKELKVSKLYGTVTPYNVNVTMGADPTSSRGFSWHTHPSISPTVVEIAKKEGFSGFESPSVIKVTGQDSLFVTYDIGTVRVHQAIVNGLEAGTEYVYRVGDGQTNFSQQGTFTTAPVDGDRLKFLFFGDSQAADAAGFNLWGNTVRKAISENPDAEFMMHAGDMVDSGHLEAQWNMFFDAAKDQLMNTTFVATLGNHEVTGSKGISDFNYHFIQPSNGVDSMKGTNFSFDYKNAHFVVLNSEPNNYEAQKNWLRQDLAATDKEWKIVVFHRGPYGSIYDTPEVRDTWTPVFDEFKVDLVLNGHDHVYLRQFMKNNQKVEQGEGTAYVVAGSTGPKFYDMIPRPWTQFYDKEQKQMYVSVEIAGNELTLVTKTVDGREVDRFTLSKVEPDLTPPVTAIAVNGQTGAKNFNNKSVTVSVYAEDGNGSGVERTEYRINQAEWTAVAESFTVQDEGINNVEYRSVDKAGNVEEAKKVTIGIDKTGPVISPPGISAVFHTDTLNLPVEVTDALSGVKEVSVTLDGNQIDLPIVKAPISLSLGEHSLTVRAVDHAGNISEQTFGLNVTIDIAHLDELVNLGADSGAISHDGILNSLLAQVRDIQSTTAGANVSGKLKELKDHVKAQSGKKIEKTFATILVDDISYIEAHLGN
ncbi:phosphodiester glycosidase family protein [Paenibacillus sp. HJGM_3]|uniref:phosphodiester glycosidase family protein n=1 Tax=Paenibacillus sp. HJGM_3 TaxID=3379816 RepID=UPI00385923B5